jgi:hypothetical protein
MGMCQGLVAIDDHTIRKILADPPLIWKVIAPEDRDIYEAELAARSGSWFSKLFGKKNAAPASIAKPVEEADLDKSWNGIHYLLTKTSLEGDPPLNFLIHGGTEVGNVDVGYGPARAITSDQVAEINAALAEIDIEELKRRYDPAEMMRLEVYPEIWNDDEEDEDGMFAYCAEYFDDLKKFIGRAAEKRLGIITYLS